jgi:hypothetical protein
MPVVQTTPVGLPEGEHDARTAVRARRRAGRIRICTCWHLSGCFVDRAVFSRLAVTLAGRIIADLYYPRVIKMA